MKKPEIPVRRFRGDQEIPMPAFKKPRQTVTGLKIVAAMLLSLAAAAVVAQDYQRPPGIPMPKPMPIEVIVVDDIDLSPARRYADRGDARTLQQAQAYADQGDANTLASAQQNTAARVAGLQRETAAGIAQAAALVPLDPSADGETTINLGGATYAGQSALGLSIAHRAGRLTFSAGAGASGGGRSLVRFGLGLRF